MRRHHLIFHADDDRDPTRLLRRPDPDDRFFCTLSRADQQSLFDTDLLDPDAFQSDWPQTRDGREHPSLETRENMRASAIRRWARTRPHPVTA
jgi:hypothetical protein